MRRISAPQLGSDEGRSQAFVSTSRAQSPEERAVSPKLYKRLMLMFSALKN